MLPIFLFTVRIAHRRGHGLLDEEGVAVRFPTGTLLFSIPTQLI
jgi:hypothetical protein